MDNSKKYNILITSSSAHYNQTLVVMLSAISNCKNSCNFYIMQCDWTDEQKQSITTFIDAYAQNTVTVIDVNNNEFLNFEMYKSHYEMWYKVLAHKYLPESVDKILYCDTDILIRKDIGKLYNIEFDDCFLCAAVHPTRITSKFEDYSSSTKKGKAWPNYFFGGIYLLNVKKFRKSNIEMDFYLGCINEVTYGWDEGLFNFLFWDKAKYVPFYKYNLILSYFKEYRYLHEIYSLSYDERIKKCNSVYHEEFFDEEENASIVHFATSGITKPWNVLIYNNRLESVNKIDESIQSFYYEWWETAKKLPNPIYEKILTEAVKTVYASPLEKKNWLQTNIIDFLVKVSYDFSEQTILFRSMQTYKGKKIAILKSADLSGKFLIHTLEQNNIEVIFHTSKSILTKLNDEEWERCKQADIIISCDIHGSVPIERDGIKPIMILDILKGHDTTALNLKALAYYNGLTENILAEIKLLKENIKKQIEALRSETKELYAVNNKLSAELSEANADNVKLNIELGTLSGEKKQLTESLTAANKRTETLSKERDALSKTVARLESETKRFESDLSNASTQNIQLTAALGEATSNLETANTQLELLTAEKHKLALTIQENDNIINELMDQLAEMEHSHSWRLTKPLRSIMWFFRRLFGKKEK